MLRTKLATFLLFMFSTLAWSQAQSASPAPKSSLSIFGGYSYLPTNFYQGSGKVFGGEGGWNAGLDLGLFKQIAFTADFAQIFSSYDLGATTDTVTFLLGPCVSVPLGKPSKIAPFGDFLIGGAHIGASGFGSTFFLTSTSFAWSADGGIDARLMKHLSLRVQGGYLRTAFVTADNQLQQDTPAGHVRLLTGIVYRLR